MFNNKQITVNAQVNWPAVFYGTLFALGSAIILLVISGVVIFYGRIAEIWLSAISYAVFAVSIFAGALFSSIKAREKGLLHGIAVGLCFLLVSSIFTWILPADITMLTFVKKVALGVLSGAFGGILGVK